MVFSILVLLVTKLILILNLSDNTFSNLQPEKNMKNAIKIVSYNITLKNH